MKKLLWRQNSIAFGIPAIAPSSAKEASEMIRRKAVTNETINRISNFLQSGCYLTITPLCNFNQIIDRL
jgi:hypothetical protein